MPRSKRLSDEAVLDAASAALLERGVTDFTLADVSKKVALSKPTLLQRFGSKDALVRRIAEREVELTRAYMESLPLEPGRAGLEQFLRTIVESMGTGKGFAARVQLAWAEARDPELRALAAERYRLVQQAIAARLPETRLPPMEVAIHLHAVIAGASMQWIAESDLDLAAYVMQRVTVALELLFPKPS